MLYRWPHPEITIPSIHRFGCSIVRFSSSSVCHRDKEKKRKRKNRKGEKGKRENEKKKRRKEEEKKEKTRQQ